MIVYEPTVFVSTDPETVIVSPPSDVAPASEYVPPSSTVAGLSPLIVITGKTVSGGVGVSSKTLSKITTPKETKSASIIDISISLDEVVAAATTVAASPSSCSSEEIRKSLLSNSSC